MRKARKKFLEVQKCSKFIKIFDIWKIKYMQKIGIKQLHNLIDLIKLQKESMNKLSDIMLKNIRENVKDSFELIKNSYKKSKQDELINQEQEQSNRLSQINSYKEWGQGQNMPQNKLRISFIGDQNQYKDPSQSFIQMYNRESKIYPPNASLLKQGEQNQLNEMQQQQQLYQQQQQQQQLYQQQQQQQLQQQKQQNQQQQQQQQKQQQQQQQIQQSCLPQIYLTPMKENRIPQLDKPSNFNSSIPQQKDKEQDLITKISYYTNAVSYTHLRAHETRHDLVCRLLLEKKKKTSNNKRKTKLEDNSQAK
eukprot:TRINITY_DN3117_c0_g1_i1.p1 TRINITY_DN3117_c0_g1~~TRINITY_DN3117_c0_g1_i1.p1  ORF type:complete len:307 (+),score=75.41 TRINITY_DN3117_c0_g1_i1:524-1444(+)